MFRRVTVHICRGVIGCNASNRPRDPSENVYETADRARVPALRQDIFEAGQQEETYIQRSLHPSQEGRGGRHLGRRRGELKRCSNILWYVSVKNPASYHTQNITFVKNGASHIVRSKDTRLNGGANVCTTLVQQTFLLCAKAYRCTS